MVVCHCMGTTDRDIRSAVRAGARDVAEVASACEAGTDCGGCLPLVEEIVRQERQAVARAAGLPVVEAA